MTDSATHAQDVARGERFEFGRNWTRFLQVLDDERIDEACKSLRRMLGMESLARCKFLDVGSGSGLFSLAAMKLGAERVFSFDFDPHSVACTLELKRRYFPDARNWTVEPGSVLDENYLERLGLFDVVYSWGVLHHTGNLWRAMANVAAPVAPGGRLFIALYRDQGWLSKLWLRVKQLYNAGLAGRALVLGTFIPLVWIQGLLGDLFRRKNPFTRGKRYKRSRGMSRLHDWVDWLGGLPFEVASAPAVLAFYEERQFRLENLGLSDGHGCNEFVFSHARRALRFRAMSASPDFPRTLLPAPPDPCGPTRSTADDLARKRYAAAGDRAYVIGTLDGGFPPIGTRIRGEMGGVWMHPIKLLSGYWFALNGSWLPAATRFTSGAGYVQLEYAEQAGLAITRTEFAPDGLPALIVGLTLRNSAVDDRQAALTMALRSQLLSAYPWTESKPNATQHNAPDRATYRAADGRTSIRRDDKPWQALIGSSVVPTEAITGDELWGPVPDAQRTCYSQSAYGTGVELRWQLPMRAGAEQTLWVVVAGDHTSAGAAEDALRRALADPGGLLAAKIRERAGLLARTQLTVPDQQVSDALVWATLNMADLRRTVTDLQIRDVNEGKDYPPPIARLPEVQGVGDGFPDYPCFYGTGSGYIVYPLIAAGLWEAALAHLRTLREVSRALNGRTGKIVHEIISDGSVYLGNNEAPGDTNETALFATATEVLWRWTGDDAVRDEMYDFVVDGMRYITGDLDSDRDLWPEGNGIGERPGMGREQVDVAANTWQALRALNRMAGSRGDDAVAAWASAQAAAMEAAFDAAWWMPDESLYADSRSNVDDVVSEDERRKNGWTNVATAPDQQLQQRVWVSVTPMEMGLAPAARAHAALARLESVDFTGPSGLFLVGEGGGPDGKAVKKCWSVIAGVMALAEAKYGRLNPDQALRYMAAIAQQLDLEQPGALPEVGPSPDYAVYGDLTERMMVSQAWASYGLSWTIVAFLLGIEPNVPARKLAVIPQLPPTWPGLAAERLRVGAGSIAVTADRDARHYRTSVDAPPGWTLTIGHTLPAGAAVAAVALDDGPAEFAIHDTVRGREVRVETTTGARRRLLVTADDRAG